MQRPASLTEKTRHARALLRGALERHGADRVAVAFTGGKDSTLALFLWRLTLLDASAGTAPLALNLDTGVKFPEVLDFRDQFARSLGVRLHIARPPDARAPVALDKAACCKERKIDPLLAAIGELGLSLLITGIRADEHPSRASLPFLEQCGGHDRLHPLLAFSEMDVWAAIQEHDLPWVPLYERGYRSLGCVPCTALPSEGGDERSGRAPQKEAVMADLRALGYF
ncbi:MAG: phosphoadenosine phosphosulfate reductase family protein [Deltaproteobacteria bacterium]|nr:phosphoadenosine phosphosulfate reductase family protein [Deltaproteobacteria bacterium]